MGLPASCGGAPSSATPSREPHTPDTPQGLAVGNRTPTRGSTHHKASGARGQLRHRANRTCPAMVAGSPPHALVNVGRTSRQFPWFPLLAGGPCYRGHCCSDNGGAKERGGSNNNKNDSNDNKNDKDNDNDYDDNNNGTKRPKAYICEAPYGALRSSTVSRPSVVGTKSIGGTTIGPTIPSGGFVPTPWAHTKRGHTQKARVGLRNTLL